MMRKYSEIIEAAKRRIGEETTFVCFAINDECRVNEVLDELEAYLSIIKRIEEVLGIDPRDDMRHTVCSKLSYEEPERHAVEYAKDRALTELRLAFMDEQIAYWKARGN